MREIRFTEEGIELEHRSWALIQTQRNNGFAFDFAEANVLYSILRQKEAELQEKIYEYWPPQLQVVGRYQRPFKKDGERSANYEKHLLQYPIVTVLPGGREYEASDYVYFNIGSPSQRISKLLELGWKPREFTKPSKTHPNGQPKATSKGQLSPSLVDFVEESGKEEVRLIAEWIEVNARANMVNTWLEAYNPSTGCIHGSLWLANTLRYRHSNPNTANIPGVRHSKKGPLLGEAGKWTYEARALWTVRDTKTRCLVGVDAKGIQLRVLAHYLNNEEFTDVVINGDPHDHNQKIGEFASRDIAKTFIYAFFLGAGDAKIGQIVGGSTKDGRELKRKFIDSTPGLKHLLTDLKRQVERTGRIKLCDGTPVIVDKPHTVLAYLLQGDESRIMKKAAILADREVKKRRLDVLKVGDIHDEWQSDALKEHSDEFAKDVCPAAFASAGANFNYRVPIGCSAHIGMNWAETH
jgi:DNA polymerase-1